MAEYRLFILDESGGISLPEAITAEEDHQALATVRALTHRARMGELWRGNRLVARLDEKDFR